MYCPICAQKPMNCICTEVERQQFSDIEDLEEKIARLRLTDAERAALEAAIAYMAPVGNYDSRVQDTLRGLLERHFPVPENQSSQDNAPETHANRDEGSVQDGVT